MLSTNIKSQNVIRCHSTKGGEIEITSQKYNDYFQDENERPLLRITETEGGYHVTVLAAKVTVGQLETAKA